ncbi:response regulator transcription factor [Sphingomonas lacunae]|uniref:Response regulator transcription factor n=1 Tax=Sphingomonas lacunae TaxID=2698828 RepID=A0A6M4AT84_9SPHN|nr:response regulator transcription factor [Sphingomonas lacunae]QJQ31289.1 response regulator transcription factor [Sphingomonas lacunae]
MTTATRILIVDDHPLAREGLKAVLTAAGLTIVGEVATGEEAVEQASALVPDVVLMDVRLGSGIDGLEATRRISALGLPTKVLMLTLHDMPGYVREALAAGAAGYVLKDTGIDELRNSVSQVMAGQTAIPLPLMASVMQAGGRVTPSPSHIDSLTERELEVLDLVSEGKTNKEIARVLGISPATVKAHVERIISKLSVSDRTQAAVLATSRRAMREGF